MGWIESMTMLLIADEVKANLIAQGWFELPNRT
jgi:hypothetical protein